MITRPRTYKHYQLCLILFISLFIHGCATTTLDSATPNNSISVQHHAEKAKNILVVNSNQSVERYRVAETTYVQSLLDMNMTIINLETESEPVEFLQDVLNENDYDIIYCIGAKALGSIGYIDPDIPVVYSSVLNWRKFKDRNQYYGIASELSPQVQLTWLKYFFPDIRKVGVFYSDENQSLIDDANKAAGNLVLKLNDFKLSHDGQLMSSAEKLLNDVDALWLISDSRVLSSIENINALFKMANKLQVPVITYNPVFMDVGAVMSLVADLPTTARQAALITTKLTEKRKPKSSIKFPAGSRIILNNDKVSDYQIKLNPGVLDSVDQFQ